MLQTFQDNLAEAEQKESEAQASYEKLRAAKLEEKAEFDTVRCGTMYRRI